MTLFGTLGRNGACPPGTQVHTRHCAGSTEAHHTLTGRGTWALQTWKQGQPLPAGHPWLIPPDPLQSTHAVLGANLREGTSQAIFMLPLLDTWGLTNPQRYFFFFSFVAVSPFLTR